MLAHGSSPPVPQILTDLTLPDRKIGNPGVGPNRVNKLYRSTVCLNTNPDKRM